MVEAGSRSALGEHSHSGRKDSSWRHRITYPMNSAMAAMVRCALLGLGLPAANGHSTAAETYGSGNLSPALR